MSITEDRIADVARAVCRVAGVRAVTLGGSRARGTHRPDSDVDLGLYYDAAHLDLDGLRALAHDLTGEAVEVSAPGEWGPWVDGGAWLRIDDTAVDWILRDVDRVREQCARARDGEFAFHAQPGHPLGFLDVSYAGEVATGIPLADPQAMIAALQRDLTPYPPALQRAFHANLWQARFLLAGARKATGRGDTAYIALCCTTAAMIAAHAWHAAAGVWVTNEKDLVPNVARLPLDTQGFSDRVRAALAHLGDTPEHLAAAIDRIAGLLDVAADTVTGGR